MADIFYWGKRGSGKTLRAIIDIWIAWIEGKEIYTNAWLHPAFNRNYKTGELGNYHYVDAVDLIKMLLEDRIPDNDKQKICLLDEIKTQANARNFGSFVNKHLADFVSQARKRNFQMIYTDQILGAYDRWIRLMTDKIIRCVPVIDLRDLGMGTPEYPEPTFFEYIVIDLSEDEIEQQEPLVYDISRKTARHFYPLYKSKGEGSIITPIELKYMDKEANA